mgnify:FL=1
MIYVVIIIAVLVFVSGCSKNATSGPVKVGVALPLTGAWAIGGEAVHQGIQVALDELNVREGAKKKPIELIIEDTRSSVPNAVTAVQKLINVDKINVIIAGALSAEAVGVAPVAQEAKVVLLAPLPLTTTVEKAGEWVFKLRESTGKHAESILVEMKKRGYLKIGIISQAYEACEDLLTQMEKYNDNVNVEFLIIEKYDPADTDMRTQLIKIKEANPEAWFSCGLYQDIGLVYKQAKELDFDKPSFSMVAIENSKLFDIAGDTAEGVIFTATKFSCEDAQAFCDKFKLKYNKFPDYRAAFGYDSLLLVAKAMEENGYSSEEIQKGLLDIKDFDGATGKTTFDAEGNAQKDVVVKQVKGRKFVEIAN